MRRKIEGARARTRCHGKTSQRDQADKDLTIQKAVIHARMALQFAIRQARLDNRACASVTIDQDPFTATIIATLLLVADPKKGRRRNDEELSRLFNAATAALQTATLQTLPIYAKLRLEANLLEERRKEHLSD